VSEKDAGRDAGDGFGILRIVAALMVIFSHAFPLSGLPEPIWRKGSVDVSFGSTGVDIFFVISGYLVYASWLRDPNRSRFAARRVARIWPGLVVMLLLTTLLMGPLVTTLSPARFLSDAGTGAYLLGSIFLMPVWSLPGVFQATPYHTVNGSLWTLPIEVSAYAGVLVAGQLLRARGWRAFTYTLGGLTAAMVLAGLGLAALGAPVFAVFAILYHWLDQPFFLFFFFGCLLYGGRDRIPLQWPVFAAAMAGMVAALLIGVMAPVFPLLAYVVVFLSTRRSAFWHRVTGLGDPSYGIYIYAYPIQQLLLFMHLAPNSLVLFVEASLLSIALGYLSWHLVESRALTFSRRVLRGRSSPAARPASAAAA
jgi:peptidoglycan/LPS O-acetylase OafA/YrhL